MKSWVSELFEKEKKVQCQFCYVEKKNSIKLLLDTSEMRWRRGRATTSTWNQLKSLLKKVIKKSLPSLFLSFFLFSHSFYFLMRVGRRLDQCEAMEGKGNYSYIEINKRRKKENLISSLFSLRSACIYISIYSKRSKREKDDQQQRRKAMQSQSKWKIERFAEWHEWALHPVSTKSTLSRWNVGRYLDSLHIYDDGR